MITLQSVIATVRGAAKLILWPPPPNRNGCSYAVTVLTPIEPGQTEALRDVLASFPLGTGSPLHTVPDVHFARWVVIDQLRTDWPGIPKRPSRLNSAYLLFSADLTAPANRADGLPETFFRELAKQIPAESTEVWGKCRGFPGVADIDAFVDYMTRSQIHMGLYYAAFPDTTPDEITRALKLREEFAQFVLKHQRTMSLAPGSPGVQQARDQLQKEYIREFK